MCMNCSVYVLQLQVLTPTAATLVDVKTVNYSHHLSLLGAVALIILEDYILILETPVKCAANVKVHDISTLPNPPLQLQAMVSTEEIVKSQCIPDRVNLSV